MIKSASDTISNNLILNTRKLKAIVRKILPDWIINAVWYSLLDKYSTKSYSQEGEDMILKYIFQGQKTGFYVDVGAHHPKRISNTYFFYKRGWSGINIDAMPGSMKSFKVSRRRDINIEVPISDRKLNMTYYIFNEPALNGFSKEISEQREKENNDYSIVKTVKLSTSTLIEILGQYLPLGQSIDFMSIDVEGLDHEVLVSNDWEKFKPKVVLIEICGKTLADIIDHKTTYFLQQHGYVLFAKCVNTVIFKLEG